jgi:hypothetical protein
MKSSCCLTLAAKLSCPSQGLYCHLCPWEKLEQEEVINIIYKEKVLLSLESSTDKSSDENDFSLGIVE